MYVGSPQTCVCVCLLTDSPSSHPRSELLKAHLSWGEGDMMADPSPSCSLLAQGVLTLTLKKTEKNPDVFFFLFLLSTSYCFNPAARLWGRTVRGSAEEAVCKGVNPERGGSRWRLFCSHGSVRESTPMQLHQLAPTHHTLTHIHIHTLPFSSFYTQPVQSVFVIPSPQTCMLTCSTCVFSISVRVCSCMPVYTPWVCVCVCMCINVYLTVRNDAKHGEEEERSSPPLVRCRCHIGSVRRVHRLAGRQAAAQPWEWHCTSALGDTRGVRARRDEIDRDYCLSCVLTLYVVEYH